jgi:hypothetical protein
VFFLPQFNPGCKPVDYISVFNAGNAAGVATNNNPSTTGLPEPYLELQNIALNTTAPLSTIFAYYK